MNRIPAIVKQIRKIYEADFPIHDTSPDLPELQGKKYTIRELQTLNYFLIDWLADEDAGIFLCVKYDYEEFILGEVISEGPYYERYQGLESTMGGAVINHLTENSEAWKFRVSGERIT